MVSSITLAIPTNNEVNFLKKIGDHVKEGEEIAEYLQNQEKVEIDVAQTLQVSPKNASKFLMKNLGDKVMKDEIIAKREKGVIFKKTIEIKSLLEGKVFELDNFSGKVKIAGAPIKKTLRSFISGRIKEEADKQIVIEFKGEEIKLKKSFGASFFALVAKVGDGKEEVDDKKINADHKDRLLLGGHFSLSDLSQAMAIGAKGILAIKINNNNFDKFKEEKVISVGDEERHIALAVGVLEEEDFSKIEKHGLHPIYFDGAGGKIIIPFS